MSKTLTLQSSEVSLDFGVLRPRREGEAVVGEKIVSKDMKWGILAKSEQLQVTLNFYDRFRISCSAHLLVRC